MQNPELRQLNSADGIPVIISFLVFPVPNVDYYILFTKQTQLNVHLLAFSAASQPFHMIFIIMIIPWVIWAQKTNYLLMYTMWYGWKLQNKQLNGPWAEIVFSVAVSNLRPDSIK